MKKEKLLKKYDKYIQLLGQVGGALTVADFLYLFNIKYKKEIEDGFVRAFSYSKVVRNFRELRKILESEDSEFELLNIYRSVVENKAGVPENIYVMCLTSKGWYYYNKSNRDEVKFEDNAVMRDIRFNAYKRIVKAEDYLNHKNNVSEILRDYNSKVYEIKIIDQESIDLEKILSTEKFIIRQFNFFEGDDSFAPHYSFDVVYYSNALSYKNLCATLDRLLGVLERTYSVYASDKSEDVAIPDIYIYLKCVTSTKANISSFIDYRNRYQRKYCYYDYVHKKNSPKKFRTFFGKNIKRIDFCTINSKYQLAEY